jgi:hypothetical protein
MIEIIETILKPIEFTDVTIDYAFLAKLELDKSNIAIMHYYENNIALPLEWKQYRQSLKDIINNSEGVTELPVRPSYPINS